MNCTLHNVMQLSDCQQNVDLSTLNTLAIPSRAQYFYRCENIDDLQSVITLVRKHNVPFYILAGGSNVLLDKTIEGLVIYIALLGKECVQKNDTSVLVRVCAGENWHDFVLWALQHGFYGLENLSLIPGSVGAAPVQNIGAYGVEVSSVIESVTVLDSTDNTVKLLSHADCRFGYRDSLFKQERQKHLIILDVTFHLQLTPSVNITYPALQKYIAIHYTNDTVTAEKVSHAVIAIRSEKLPDPNAMPNAGSFFKNTVVDNASYQRLLSAYPGLPAYDYDEGFKKIPTAWCIDYLGWKGRVVDDVYVHPEHALVIINPNKKPLQNVLNLAKAIQEDVKAHFGFWLEIEPQKLLNYY